MGMDNITFVSPRYNTRHQPPRQVEWETQGLRICDVALFWIPNKDPNAELGSRVYAETTRMELAENLPRGKKVILGIDTEISGTRHMKFLAKRYGIKKVHTTMEGCLQELKEWIEQKNKKQLVHKLEIPKFDSSEALKSHPEFVDMLAMNQTWVERWNKTVSPDDIVHIQGAIGDSEWLGYLNGEIIHDQDNSN